MEDVDYVIARATENVRRRLADYQVTELVYAVGMFGPDPTALFAAEITLGLECDRRAALESQTPYDAFFTVWNAWEFGLDRCPHGPSLDDDPSYLAAQRRAFQAIRGDAQRYVLNRVAANVTHDDPLPRVTEDFVAFAFAEDFDRQLLENLRFSATPHARDLLRSKRLYADDPGLLPTPS